MGVRDQERTGVKDREITTSLLQRCLRDRSAGVALMFAVTAIPIIGTIGIAIDLGLVTQAKTQLNLATDAAALAAAKGAADAFTAGQQNYIAAGKAAGVEWFNSQVESVLGTTLDAPLVTVTQSGAVFNSNVSYQGSVKPYFGPLFGVSKVALGGLSSATITTTAYVSVTFLLDNSSSMLIPATQVGVDQMNSLTPVSGQNARNAVPDGLGNLQCAFACHWEPNGKDYYGLARTNNILLRFDVLQNAVASAINKMISQKMIADQFSVGIYTFGNILTKIFPPDANHIDSTNLEDAAKTATHIVTPVVPDQANTDFPAVMNSLAQVSAPAGDGSSTASRKRALIIVTDGLVDYGSRTTPTSRGPINPVDCAAMKALGYNVYVLYTTYITTPSNLVLPFDNIDLLPYINGSASPAMVPSLTACASAPTNFAEASDPAAINAAMTQLLQAALGNGGRYTQ